MSEKPESYNLKPINPDIPVDAHAIRKLIDKAQEAVSMLDWVINRPMYPVPSLKRWIVDLSKATKELEETINNL
jgi:hypothetical protein